MITKEQVIPILLNACPSFTEKWAKHCTYWEDENSLYHDLSEFSCHLIELHKSNQVHELPAVFEVVERLHLDGDDYVKEAVTIGLLEGIQNIASNANLNAEEFIQYLKPESAKQWKQLNEFWDGKTHLSAQR